MSRVLGDDGREVALADDEHPVCAWVQYRGQEIMLVRTADALRFGRTYQAIQRALEQHGGDR